MNKKKTPTKNSQSLNTFTANDTKTTAKVPILSARCIRLVHKLAAGPITREQADNAAPASNSPDLVSLIRKRLGVELPCNRIKFLTVDGKPSFYGRYTPTREDQEVLRSYLRSLPGGEQ